MPDHGGQPAGRALQAATIQPARMLGIDPLGQIEAGLKTAGGMAGTFGFDPIG